MRVGLLQLTSGDRPEVNLPITLDMINQAAAQGAEVVITPEVTNCVSISRAHQMDVLRAEEDDQTLRAIRALAKKQQIWVILGSIAVKTSDPDGRFANRQFVINPAGDIAARYDKMHMFDVSLSETESYRESAGYRPGKDAVVASIAGVKVGLSICYDLRFPYLYRDLAQSGAKVLIVPSAFSVPTGAAHWEVLLRARAIETGCFVLAPAQTGDHKGRRTYGHSQSV